MKQKKKHLQVFFNISLLISLLSQSINVLQLKNLFKSYLHIFVFHDYLFPVLDIPNEVFMNVLFLSWMLLYCVALIYARVTNELKLYRVLHLGEVGWSVVKCSEVFEV
jgi:hypothetical protein